MSIESQEPDEIDEKQALLSQEEVKQKYDE